MLTIMYKPMLFCLCFLACRKAATTNNRSNPVTLKLSECVHVQRPPGNLNVCLDSLNDSRCPANVTCIWAGVAVVKLSITANNNVQSFKLSTLNSKAFPPADTTVANHRFQLVNVQPYPGTGSNAVPSIDLVID